MIDEACKNSILNKIISSTAFINSDKYIELLKYLVQCDINHISIKEYTLAVEIFKKDKGFNPADNSQVRIYMHRLRNKIEAYYENEGKSDKIELVIPKGHYEVKFQPKSMIRRRQFKNLSLINIILVGLLIALVPVVFGVIYFQKKNFSSQEIDDPISKEDPIWAHFFSNKLSTTIVVGDDFQFWELDEALGVGRQVIDYKITNAKDFDLLSKQNQKLKRERHGALPINSVWNIYDLTHVLYSFNQKADIELSSLFMATQFDLRNVVDRNIIYIGGFRNLREFSNILAKLPVEYQYTDLFKGVLNVKVPDTDSVFTIAGKKLNEPYHRDVGLIAKLAGSNNENYLFLLGFAFPAQIETVRMLCRNDLLRKVYSQIKLDQSQFPEHFFLIVEILCTEFSPIETKIKYFQEIHFEEKK